MDTHPARPRRSWTRTVRDGVLLAGLAGLLVAGHRYAGAPSRNAPPWGHTGPPAGWTPHALTAPVAAAILLIVLAVALRGRSPRAAYAVGVLATAGYLALGGTTPAALVGLAVLSFALTRRAGFLTGWPWLLALVPVLWVRFWDEPLLGLADAATYGAILTGLVWVLLPSLIGTLVATRREAAARAHAEDLHRVAYEERLRVARDIHDVVGHSLSMISLQSGVALRLLDADPGQARTSLEAIRSASRDSLAELRRTLGVFREPDESQPIAPTPDLASIGPLVASVREGGREIAYSPAPQPAAVPVALQTVAYRVVQEALTNAVRHAPGAAVSVEVAQAPGRLVMTVTDEGPGRRGSAEGLGLRGMRERVQAVGGTLSVTVAAGARGVRVRAELPLGRKP